MLLSLAYTLKHVNLHTVNKNRPPFSASQPTGKPRRSFEATLHTPIFNQFGRHVHQKSKRRLRRKMNTASREFARSPLLLKIQGANEPSRRFRRLQLFRSDCEKKSQWSGLRPENREILKRPKFLKYKTQDKSQYGYRPFTQQPLSSAYTAATRLIVSQVKPLPCKSCNRNS